MRKRPLHILSLISAVVCVQSLGVVVRSFFRLDGVWAQVRREHGIKAVTLDGRLWLSVEPYPLGYTAYFVDEAAANREFYDWMWGELSGVRWLGIGWGNASSARGDYYTVVLPLWLVPIVTAVLPVRWWVIRRRSGGGRGFSVEVAGESAVGTEGAGDSE
jgi:hypothetical protein